MSMDVRALLMKKSEEKSNSNRRVVMKDVNRDLMVALLAIPVYGKEARDEEILSVIINAGTHDVSDTITKLRENYNKLVAEKKVKKTKAGGVRDLDGYMVLVPRP
ncbi:MAG: hypothetical protein NC311_05670 [Muribaculaceae bacterium]|nr:hypothetical protein [Muribaculaceae bacterium]